MLRLSLAAGASAAFLTAATLPAVAFEEAETREIETIVRDYLIRNPEVLLEALDALETKRTTEARAQQGAAITSVASELTASPEGTVLGNPDGDVTVVEFFDYNCGFCKRALADKAALLASDPNVRIVLKEVPVLGPPSEAATRVSLAVRTATPTSYEAFHNTLLASRGVADEARAFEVVRELGLDEDAIRAALGGEAVAAALDESARLASLLQIDGTPTYVIGNAVMPGAVGVDALAARVADAREQAAAAR